MKLTESRLRKIIREEMKMAQLTDAERDVVQAVRGALEKEGIETKESPMRTGIFVAIGDTGSFTAKDVEVRGVSDGTISGSLHHRRTDSVMPATYEGNYVDIAVGVSEAIN